jgi:hypothetical protein
MNTENRLKIMYEIYRKNIKDSDLSVYENMEYFNKWQKIVTVLEKQLLNNQNK